ncbi:MAG: DEAD/DEAH box helicase [Candidatus Micrarchaeaceae archaeon]|jgi:ATP-dependent DNA helicase PIF1
MGLQNKIGTESNAIELNGNFRMALKLLENTSQNVFITGKAGTGKSTLLEYFRSITEKNIAVLAPTGVAALNVKGQTIHSFFHFKPDITPDTVKRAYNASIYKALDTIIIDEISMVRADLLDCIDRFMRLSGRDSTLPFGGVQMIFIGDLYQLSPVVTEAEQEIFNGPYKSQYFFDSYSFNELKFEFVELTKHYRQKDKAFIELLNAIRNNSATDAHLNDLNRRFNPSFFPKDSDMYITLTTTNKLADIINDINLSKIPRISCTYAASITGEFNKNFLPADENLVLKEGAQVMLLNNDINKRWVNGSIGKVIRMEEEDLDGSIVIRLIDGSEVHVEPYTWELFKFSYDNITKRLSSNKMGSFRQYPMMLSWAVTIHKSQGKTFDHVVIDIGSGTFAHGQLYVALSRCTTLDGIVLKKRVEKRHILTDVRIVNFLKKYEDASKMSLDDSLKAL